MLYFLLPTNNFKTGDICFCKQVRGRAVHLTVTCPTPLRGKGDNVSLFC